MREANEKMEVSSLLLLLLLLFLFDLSRRSKREDRRMRLPWADESASMESFESIVSLFVNCCLMLKLYEVL